MSESFREATLRLAAETPEANQRRIDEALRLSATLDEFRARRRDGEVLQTRRVELFTASEAKVAAALEAIELLGGADPRREELRRAREQISRRIAEAEDRRAAAGSDWSQAELEFAAGLGETTPTVTIGDLN